MAANLAKGESLTILRRLIRELRLLKPGVCTEHLKDGNLSWNIEAVGVSSHPPSLRFSKVHSTQWGYEPLHKWQFSVEWMTTMSWVNITHVWIKIGTGSKRVHCANPLLLVIPEKAWRPLYGMNESQIWQILRSLVIFHLFGVEICSNRFVVVVSRISNIDRY